MCFGDLARRVAAREEAGSDRVGGLGMLLSASLALSSSSYLLVTCSPSWPSAIGLPLSCPVKKRCRIESNISGSMWPFPESGTVNSDGSIF